MDNSVCVNKRKRYRGDRTAGPTVVRDELLAILSRDYPAP